MYISIKTQETKFDVREIWLNLLFIVGHLMWTLMSFANLLLGHWQRVRRPVTDDITAVYLLEHNKNKMKKQ